MKDRFELFVTSITQIYKSIQKLKSQEMADLGLRGTHVMCLYQLQQHPEGLTSGQLTKICAEDKAAISRTVAELRQLELVSLPEQTEKRYRERLTLTEKGKKITAQMEPKINSAVWAGSQGYSQQEREIFYRVLTTVADNLQRVSSGEEEMP